jgi:hypothetical protein
MLFCRSPQFWCVPDERLPGGARKLCWARTPSEPVAVGDRAPEASGRPTMPAGQRDLSARQFTSTWARFAEVPPAKPGGRARRVDGVYPQARMEPQAECMLVLLEPRRKARRSCLGP